MTPVRIATWNLWWRFGDPDARRPAIAASLRALDADVVGLQEVWSRGDEHLTAGLADELDRYVAFAGVPDASPWTGRLGDDSWGLGNAVLSRWPLRDVRTEILPSGDGPAAQVLLAAVVDTPAGSLRVVVTHLASALTASATRVAQVRAIVRHVATAGETDLPPVVVGDLNAEPASDEVRLLEGHLTAPAEPGLLLADAWRWAAGPDRLDGATWRRENPYVAARGEPPSRIDYVLVGLGRGTVPVAVEHAALFADRAPTAGPWPSDHAGVVADLRAGP
ncbi:MAG TPA: endonuclease/exonuclease/phosphatase family protein [Actinomycetospora sp.]|nr:endonuclease/exonuclease/phosphatase family protein [Actinomycetospora sp.]